MGVQILLRAWGDSVKDQGQRKHREQNVAVHNGEDPMEHRCLLADM